MRWEYRDKARRLLGIVCRFDVEDGGKGIRSLVFAAHKRWGPQWRWLGFLKPRPLYGWDRLAARPDAPVVICEGEKAADAAARSGSDHLARRQQGRPCGGLVGAGRPPESHHMARRGQAGRGYARDVCDMLVKLSPAPAIAIVKPPAGVSEGWDAADALAAGITPAQAAELIARAIPTSSDGAAASHERKTHTREWLIDLLGEAELWHDPERVVYATVPVCGRRQNYEIGSIGFKDWLALCAYETTGNVPAAEAIEAALRIARAQALRGPCYRTWRRTAEHDGAIYVDLGCPKWRAVEIAATGWRVVDAVPVKFLLSRGMEALPEPEAGETIALLREFVNVESGNRRSRRLQGCWSIQGPPHRAVRHETSAIFSSAPPTPGC
jgi:hypothetical protein